ncbi:beta-galactosidase [Lactiplantibacillus pentosus]|uniref:Beta-galactosidase n=1 Tax=Lactiplantibacillus pentosus TaxID=1589 RepID=A0AB37RIC8_LACPE|nr:beta-galactosidase [Lactiplantibacillus pentosus]RMW42370.1 beta-galactosidase [Lactiplantibacillus pentosus]RMW48460.1 beta-galactosidase [Lactiplantibacillus pentosus]RMW52597.1 beta-galactosidase [Lactiplantibacillus pentosus]RMW55331.1 beta-galactosidase [Lactiplantibacillus pentosus]
MKNILYGTAYYYEYLPVDRLAKDIEMMTAANINVVRIGESTWSTYEPQDGVFDFSSLDKVLDAMHDAGIQVVVGTPTYAIPTWLAKTYPEVMVQVDGRRKPYGARQIFDITNPIFLRYAERIVRKMVQHVAQHPAVIGFQVDNETKHYGTSSENVQKGFVRTLKQEFKDDLDRLNQVFGLDYWSNRINAWEDFPSMDGTINGSLQTAFETYRQKLVTDYLAWQVSLVDDYRRTDQFVTHNFDFEWRGYSYGIQPEVNHFDASAALTYAGGDIYHPSRKHLTGTEIAFAGDELRSLKHTNYLVMETQAQAFKQQVPYPGQLRQLAYSHLASGANMVEYWHWHSIHNSAETYWKGILSHDFQPNPVYEEVKQTGAELKRLSSHLVNLKVTAQVAFLASNRSFTALNAFPFSNKRNYNDLFRALYDQFYRLNIRTDITDEYHIRLQDYQLVVVPALYSVSDAFLDELDDYVKNGGHVIYTFKTGFTDEYVKVRMDQQPGRLTKATGVHYNLFVDPDGTQLVGQSPSLRQVMDTSLQDWMELLIPDTAEVLATYDDPNWAEYAAITKNYYGQGSTLYIGCYPSASMLAQLITDYTQELGLRQFTSAFPVIVKQGTNDFAKVVTYYFNYSSVTQTVNDVVTGTDLVTDQPVAQTLTLAPWGVAVIESV